MKENEGCDAMREEKVGMRWKIREGRSDGVRKKKGRRR